MVQLGFVEQEGDVPETVPLGSGLTHKIRCPTLYRQAPDFVLCCPTPNLLQTKQLLLVIEMCKVGRERGALGLR